jgi:hypothetical protein
MATGAATIGVSGAGFSVVGGEEGVQDETKKKRSVK